MRLILVLTCICEFCSEFAFGAVIGTVGCGIPPLMPTLIRSVRSLLKEGFLATGTFKPPLPEGALPGLVAVGLV